MSAGQFSVGKGRDAGAAGGGRSAACALSVA